MSKENFEFQTESKQLLDLMVHSIYSNKEIFLRELISNASDALDRRRLEELSGSIPTESGGREIRIETDSENRTLTLSDDGIGMSKEELISNLGTIAKSGTGELLKKLKDAQDSDGEGSAGLIGQFGVGFYSAFMIADQISVLTKRVGSESAYLWESTGDGSYSISDSDKTEPGTKITLHLKAVDEENSIEDYTQEWILRRIIKQYSDFISHPIVMKVKSFEGEGDEQKEIEKDETLNSMKPIWAKMEQDVSDEEYNEFYRSVSHDFMDPLSRIPIRAEGMLEYQSLLFIPEHAPFDFYYQGYKSGLTLYVKRVKIVDHLEELLPHYLRFVKGVVETADLPLNISREILQHDRRLAMIKKNLTSKVLSALSGMQEKESEKYGKFFDAFGPAIKEGLTTDFENKDKLTDLLLFQSSNSKSDLTSLNGYVSRMKDDQKEIYFITGDSRTAMENSPHLEIFKEKEIEVLFLDDPVDELVVQTLTEYNEKPLKNIEKGDIELGSEEEREEKKKELEKESEKLGDFLENLKEALSEQIKDVRLTNRLVDAPACLVTDENDMTPHLQKLMKGAAGTFGNMSIKRILELNPKHAIVQKLQTQPDKVGEFAELLFGYAQLAEGAELSNPKKFNEMLVKLMSDTL